MLFVVTSHFQANLPNHSRLIVRVSDEDAPSNENQFDAGEIISIGRDEATGKELSEEQLVKRKNSDEVKLIGHLNAGGRLLDPVRQQEDCQKCLAESCKAIAKKIKALAGQRRLLDKECEQEEIKALGDQIGALQKKRETLLAWSKFDKDAWLKKFSPEAVKKAS
jgi:hypothetical protein